jgi:sugar/nucleoside kinase (ribokinase family)
MGMHTAIVTACGPDLDLSPLEGLQVHAHRSTLSTTFENVYTPEGRVQTLRDAAQRLDLQSIPDALRRAEIVQFGPIANEIDPAIVGHFADAFVGLTPQGWLRIWDADGRVSTQPWDRLSGLLEQADAVVLSLEDIGGDWKTAQAVADRCKRLAMTDGPRGTAVYTEGQRWLVPAPQVPELDPTGAGDIFAAVFFIMLKRSGEIVPAAQAANRLAAASVTRSGLASTPTPAETQALRLKDA